MQNRSIPLHRRVDTETVSEDHLKLIPVTYIIPIASALLETSCSGLPPVQVVAIKDDVFEFVVSRPRAIASESISSETIWSSEIIPRSEKFD